MLLEEVAVARHMRTRTWRCRRTVQGSTRTTAAIAVVAAAAKLVAVAGDAAVVAVHRVQQVAASPSPSAKSNTNTSTNTGANPTPCIPQQHTASPAVINPCRMQWARKHVCCRAAHVHPASIGATGGQEIAARRKHRILVCQQPRFVPQKRLRQRGLQERESVCVCVCVRVCE